ncbi:hypothetical protein C8R45DRAFT_1105834 [Mycena sanguinolenta]|nr:hypothetical protein C8R45DRAFT_1105834 [Mycena sanguinolenta]
MENMFAPIIPGSDGSTFFLVSMNQTVLMLGPALLRNASLSRIDATIDLWGDTNGTSFVTVYAPETATTASWNGKTIANVHTTAPGVLTFSVGGTAPKINVPDLFKATWKTADSLPKFSPTRTIRGGSMRIGRPAQIRSSNITASYEGPVLWRCHFNGTGSETAVSLSITGGRGFAGSVWSSSALRTEIRATTQL